MQNSSLTPFLTHALTWYDRGFNVVPLRPGAKGAGMVGWSEGKYHIFGGGRYERSQIEAWCKFYPDSNVGIFPASGDAMVIDIDVDDPAVFAAVERICGPTPAITRTPRGGYHLWYRGAVKSQDAICPKVDVKSNKQHINAPGNLRDGKTYTMAQWGTLPYPRLEWRARLAALSGAVLQPTVESLKDILSTLPNDMRRPIAHVVKGNPFADPGSRDRTLYDILLICAEKWPYADIEYIQRLLAPSIAMMARTDPEGALTPHDVEDKWTRITDAAQNEVDQQAKCRQSDRQSMWALVGRQSDEPIEDDGSPLILQCGRAYSVRIGPLWTTPMMRDEALSTSMAARLAALYPGLPDQLSTIQRDRLRKIDRMEYSYVAQEPTFDPGESSLTLPCAPRADLEPEYDAEIHDWLAAFAGPHWPKLAQWLQGLLRLDHPLRALVLSGPRGCGKSLFVRAIAQLWRGGAVPIRDTLGANFNEVVLRSPLIVGDDDMEIGGKLMAHIRDAVSTREQEVRRKYMGPMTVRGSLRYVVCTNDLQELVSASLSYRLNKDAVAAIQERFLHIPVQPTDIPSPRYLADGGLARHILAAYYGPESALAGPSTRFWCEGTNTDLGWMLLVSSELRKDILYRLATSPVGARRQGDHYVIDVPTFVEEWYDRRRGATARNVADAIGAMSDGDGHGVPVALVEWYAGHHR